MRKTKFIEFNLIWIFVFTVPLFIAGIIVSPYSPQLQFMLLTIASLIYFSLAMIHHHRNKSLKIEIIVEYFLIAMLCLIIVQSLIM